MLSSIRPVGGTQLGRLDLATRDEFGAWRSRLGPPVPVIVAAEAWETLLEAARATSDPVAAPRVFRLFMRRGQPREVVAATEVEPVWRNARGVLRWKEGGYPSLAERLRKGGNAFIRGDTQLTTHDAWWMGREQTDLRLLLAGAGKGPVSVAAWWARAGTPGLGNSLETDGELWPVSLLVADDV